MAIGATSGIDVNSVVSQLMSIERQPLQALDKKSASLQAKITALGLFNSKVAALQSAAKSLGSSSSSSFLAFKATSSDATVFSASAASTAVAGSYALNITTLAQAQKLVAVGQVSDTAIIGAPAGSTTVTITTGGVATPITIDATNNTLQGISSAINAANIGVSATIINDGSGAPFRLALSSKATGLSNSITITTNVGTGGDATIDSLLAYPPGGGTMAQTVAAQDASFTVNGIAVTSSSNTNTTAIPGVTLTLSKTATPATLTVARDTTAVNDAVAAFAKAYNDLSTSIKNSVAYKSKSALEGDATLRDLQSQMRSIADAAVGGGTISHLYEAGLSFQKDGTLLLDSAKLSSAMSTNFADVANLFNSATGYATKFDAWATTTLTPGGTLDTRKQGINDSISRITAQRDALDVRLIRVEKQYRTQYSSLNVLMTQMAKTSDYLARQLG